MAGVDPVVDHPGDGEMRRRPALVVRDGDDPCPADGVLVDIEELVGQLAMDGGDHRRVGIALRVDRPGHGVVVDDVEVPGVVVGPHDVAKLGDGRADAVVLGLRDLPAPLHGAGRVPRGVQDDLMAGGGIAPGQEVDHQLDSPVQARGDGGPGRRYHSYPHWFQ